MERELVVPPLGRMAKLADVLMTPVMYCLMGTVREIPQRTHCWNNKHLNRLQVNHLDEYWMVHCDGILNAPAFRPILFHLPITRHGWREYVVIRPEAAEPWHVGWITDHIIGVSQIVLDGPVRLLLGPLPVKFFGISRRNDSQIRIIRNGRGRIGDNGPYRHLTLL